ncbi:family 43 glycosylhydrolase [Actinopolymorpha rutila]|uniref:Beta-xylosidase n=1 Tax=Actinopolymorpha rutila TaxID=446787 RepID=A0A852ZHV1_9ACTN|nr:family 43 glycosylhydrolase [Actinopolymorpha rutila]NYH88660.1 beta-xylosidase [Actinopolymorpha rutila]
MRTLVRATAIFVLALAAVCGTPGRAPVRPAAAAGPPAADGQPCAVRAGEGSYPNPLNECAAADPGMVIRGSTWYAFTTGMKLYKSSDFGHTWSDLGRFLQVPAGYVDAWAPEVYRIGNTWICYFSMRPGPGQFAKVFVATSDRLESGWQLREQPLAEDPTVSKIDASMFRAPDGRRYLLYKEIGNRRIMIDRLSADGLTVAGQPTPILSNTLPWEGNSVEAPSMVYRRHDQHYYLFYSGNLYTPTGHYGVGVARATSPTASFDAGKLPEPILRGDADFASPGHQFPTQATVDGRRTDVLFYHAYPLRDPAGNPLPSPAPRALMMDVLTWGADGWPRVHDGTPSR